MEDKTININEELNFAIQCLARAELAINSARGTVMELLHKLQDGDSDE